MVIQYTVENLNQLSASRLDTQLAQTIRSLGIAKKKTHRGSKGSKHRSTKDRPSLRPQSADSCFGVYKNKRTGKSNQFCAGLLNARSVRNKGHVICETILDRELDALFLTETWLSESDDVSITDLTPEGFHFIHDPRKSKKGGGVGLVYQSDIKIQQNKWNLTSCEGLDIDTHLNKKPVRVLLIYRPPQCNKRIFLLNLVIFYLKS